MPKTNWEYVLESIAKKNHTTVESVRREMVLAIEAGRKSPDPAVQNRWQKIALQGEEGELEAILDYLLGQVQNL